MNEITVFEWGLWEWLYIDGLLKFERLANNPNDLMFVTILEATTTPHNFAALDEVPGAADPDHDGCFWMVDDPPKKLLDIDPRISAALVYCDYAAVVAAGIDRIVSAIRTSTPWERT